MRKLLLSVVAVGGLLAFADTGAHAMTVAPAPHVAPQHAAVTQVDYYWNHHHYHHRRWEHKHWYYYD